MAPRDIKKNITWQQIIIEAIRAKNEANKAKNNQQCSQIVYFTACYLLSALKITIASINLNFISTLFMCRYFTSVRAIILVVMFFPLRH